jgi:hypothetical protein
MRKIEAFIITLVVIIGGAFVVEMFFAKPNVGELVQGFIPHCLVMKPFTSPSVLLERRNASQPLPPFVIGANTPDQYIGKRNLVSHKI